MAYAKDVRSHSTERGIVTFGKIQIFQCNIKWKTILTMQKQWIAKHTLKNCFKIC